MVEGCVVGVENNDKDGLVSILVRQDHDFEGKITPHIVANFSFVNEIRFAGRMNSGVAEIVSFTGTEKKHPGGSGSYFEWVMLLDKLEIRFSSSGSFLETNAEIVMRTAGGHLA